MYVAPARRVTDPYLAEDGQVGGVALEDREVDNRPEHPSGPHQVVPVDVPGRVVAASVGAAVATAARAAGAAC